MTSPPTIPSGWRELAFSDAVRINPQVRMNRGDTYPFVDMASVNGDRKPAMASEQRDFKGGGSRFQRGDTLMARITPCLENGKIAQYVPTDSVGEAHGSTEFIVIRGRPEVSDTDYSYYLTKWDGVRQYAISQMTGTSGRQRVPTEALNHLEIPLPPLDQQRAIAHILGTLDDKIELNRRMNETLEAMARALFTSWFVDFEPVRAKMDCRWHRGESLPGLPAELWDLFPDRLAPSQLGDIPEGWQVKALGEVVAFHDNLRIPLNSRERAARRGPYPYYGAAGILDHVDDYLFDGIFILVGEDGTVMTDEGLASPQYVRGQFWVNNHAHVLKGAHGISDEHLYVALQQVNIAPFITGAVQPKVSQTNLKQVPLMAPSQATSDLFASTVRPYFDQLRLNTEESRALAAQRDALLPRLVSGEVRV